MSAPRDPVRGRAVCVHTAESCNKVQRMRTFHHEVGDILATIADTVQPRRFDEFLRWGFDDPRP